MSYKSTFMIILFWLIATMNNEAAFGKTKTIIDYYLEIPSQYLEMRSDIDGHYLTTKEKLGVIQVRDEAHGYIRVKSDKLTSEYTVALFKTRDKGIVIGIIDDGASVQQPIAFVSPRQEGWVKVTDKVFPQISKDYILKKYNQIKPKGHIYTKQDLMQSAHSIVRYALPKIGTTIVAYMGLDDDGVSKIELFQLKFDGIKFIADE